MEMFETEVLLDNSSFAGLMRCYKPELESHQEFLNDFPEHRVTDYVSLAQILTAICLYDVILVEGSSTGHYNSAVDIIPSHGKMISRDQASNWVNDLCKMLPKEIQTIIKSEPFYTTNDRILKLDGPSQELAFNLFKTHLRNRMILKSNEKIPNVYSSKTYINRKRFEELNNKSDSPLSENELIQAMFLHRGILLDFISSEYSHMTYFPYSYRGKLLELLPPNTSSLVFEKDIFTGIGIDSTPSNRKVIELINIAYYEILDQCTWTKYNSFIPFIGAGILEQTKYNVTDSLEVALKYRNSTNLKEIIQEMMEWRTDRVRFEYYLNKFKEELKNATKSFKRNTSSNNIEIAANLSIFWLPFGLKDPVVEGLKRLPDEWKSSFNKIIDRVKKHEGHQIFLIDHIKAINQVNSHLKRSKQ